MREILYDSEHFYWKEIIINVVLALILTLKMAGIAPSLTFLNYFVGVGVFTLFAANLNTDKNSLADFKTCHKNTNSVSEVVHTLECQEILIPAYLYALSALCVSLAVFHLILIFTVASANFLFNCCCARERRSDLQVLFLQA